MTTTFLRAHQIVELARKGDQRVCHARTTTPSTSVFSDAQVEPAARDLFRKLRALAPAIRESFRRPILKHLQVEEVSLVDKPMPGRQFIHVKQEGQD